MRRATTRCALLSSAVDGSVVVWNPLAHNRTDVVTARLDEPFGDGVRVLDADGNERARARRARRAVGQLAGARRPVAGLAGVPAEREAPARPAGKPLDGTIPEIGNEHYRLRVDPARGGGVSLADRRRPRADRRRPGRQRARRLRRVPGAPARPARVRGTCCRRARWSARRPAPPPSRCRRYRCPLGERMVVRGRIGRLLRYTQTLTLWHGVDARRLPHHDRRVHRRGPAAAAALAVPGARRDAGQRGRRRGDRPRLRRCCTSPAPTDVRRHREVSRPRWTTRPTAGSGCRRRCGSGSATTCARCRWPRWCRRREAESAPLARDLMVALVRAGVTATCSSADKPRYGDLDRRLQPARRPHRARRPRRERLHRSGSGRSGSRLRRGAQAAALRHRRCQGVGAGGRAACGDAGCPAPTCAASRALPVLIVAGDGSRDAVASVVDDLADAEIIGRPDRRRRRRSRSSSAPSRCSTAACRLRRRHRRHPAHVADAVVHRLAVGDVDRPAAAHRSRRLELPAAALDPHLRLRAGRRRRRLAVGRHPRAQRGVLPPAVGRRWKRQRRRRIARRGARCWRSNPPARVQLGALKAAGNPLASGSSQPVDPTDGSGGATGRNIAARTTDVAITSGLRKVSSASRVDLLEQPRLQQHRAFDGLTLHGYEIATVLTRLNLPRVLDADHAALAPEAEAAQPLYARYWLHNRGPAPLGGLPAVAHLHPQAIVAEPECVKCCFGLPRPATAPTRRCTARCGCCARRLDGRARRAAVRAAAAASTWKPTSS